MKRKTKRVISGALALTMSMGMTVNVHATTIEEAQKKADQLQSQKTLQRQKRILSRNSCLEL